MEVDNSNEWMYWWRWMKKERESTRNKEGGASSMEGGRRWSQKGLENVVDKTLGKEEGNKKGD